MKIKMIKFLKALFAAGCGFAVSYLAFSLPIALSDGSGEGFVKVAIAAGVCLALLFLLAGALTLEKKKEHTAQNAALRRRHEARTQTCREYYEGTPYQVIL